MILTLKIILFSSFFYIVMSRHLDFRERFLERKRLRALNAQRVSVLNKLANTVILDDITHYRKVKGRFLKKIRAIEKDFRRLLAMNGMKYNYKRDLFWRTWRKIPPVNGATNEIVSYKCNNLKYANSTTCQTCGTWTIEDTTPPCPFEFFSLLSDESFCGANITQYKDTKHKCPSVIKFSDLTATCDNPIETQWRFTKMYGVTEDQDSFICKNLDFCEIFTSYEITPELVVFRIINSTNDVIYSRIMKAKNKNYICKEDCGHFNPETRKVTKANSKPLKLDLFTAGKTKRNDLMSEIVTKKELLKEINENITKREDLLKGNNENVTKTDPANEMKVNVTKTIELLNENDKNRGKINESETQRPTLENINRDDTLNEIEQSENDLVNEIDDSDAKGDFVNEKSDSDTKTNEVLTEMNNSDADEDTSNESTHLSITRREKLINELLPLEEDLSLLNWGGSAFDLVSVEVGSLHNIKSRGKQIKFEIEKEKSSHRTQNTLVSKERHSGGISHKPTVTPRFKLKNKQEYVSYEDENQGMVYS